MQCAIVIRRSDRVRTACLALSVMTAVLAAPAIARDQSGPAATREPDAQDIAMTPLNDLNLAKDEVPAVLLAAIADPYAADAADTCAAIQAAIAELDGALGPDMDVTLPGSDRVSTGRMAKSVVASFIPFRGVLREISGAAEQERVLRAAIYAGAVRRGFLKGIGQQKGCDYPARPAFARVAIALPQTPPRKPGKAKAGTKLAAVPALAPAFVSEPVIQALPHK
jgi:hypothetical protein